LETNPGLSRSVDAWLGPKDTAHTAVSRFWLRLFIVFRQDRKTECGRVFWEEITSSVLGLLSVPCLRVLQVTGSSGCGSVTQERATREGKLGVASHIVHSWLEQAALHRS
jgi:hypothetical protein